MVATTRSSRSLLSFLFSMKHETCIKTGEITLKFDALLVSYLNEKLFKPSAIVSLSQYLDSMQKWNKTYNLTAVTTPHEMVVLHILDSLVIQPFISGKRIIDVGSGAGLPGIPLAIINPDKQFVLLDSNHKKTRFLTQAQIELGLKNIEIVCDRVEKYKPTQCFDHVITRAFASLDDVLIKTQHLCCHQGTFLAMKGTYPKEEIQSIPDQFVVQKAEQLHVPDLNAERHLVIIEFKN